MGVVFLLVCKFLENNIIRNTDESIKLKADKRLSEVVDLPIVAFVRIIIGIYQSK